MHIYQYNTQAIIDEILEKCGMENNPYVRDSIRQKLTAVCKTIPAVRNGENVSLWEKSRFVPAGNKKAGHFFTEEEKNIILSHPALKAYIGKYSSGETAGEQEQLAAEAELLNIFNAQLDNLPEADGTGGEENLAASCFYTREEAHFEKLFLMVEALFLQHFTPIDEELLWNDMNKLPLLASTNTDFTPEIIKAIKRFKKKDYYKPRNH